VICATACSFAIVAVAVWTRPVASLTSTVTLRAYGSHAETRNASAVGSKIALPAASLGALVGELSPQLITSAVAPTRRRTSRRLGSVTGRDITRS
jgi:hypothetical protein